MFLNFTVRIGSDVSNIVRPLLFFITSFFRLTQQIPTTCRVSTLRSPDLITISGGNLHNLNYEVARTLGWSVKK